MRYVRRTRALYAHARSLVNQSGSSLAPSLASTFRPRRLRHTFLVLHRSLRSRRNMVHDSAPLLAHPSSGIRNLGIASKRDRLAYLGYAHLRTSLSHPPSFARVAESCRPAAIPTYRLRSRQATSSSRTHLACRALLDRLELLDPPSRACCRRLKTAQANEVLGSAARACRSAFSRPLARRTRNRLRSAAPRACRASHC